MQPVFLLKKFANNNKLCYNLYRNIVYQKGENKMGRIRTQRAYQEKKSRLIYVLRLSERDLYVDYGSSESYKDIYRKHYEKKNSRTMEYIEQLQEKEQRPCMIELEEGEYTQVEAYGKVLVWIRYFLDRGYNVISGDQTLSYAKDLRGINREEYENEKNKLSIDQVFKCEKCLVSSFKKIACRKGEEQ